MPNLVGKQVADAIATLQADGLQVGATHLIASKRPNGEVVSTNPKSGTHVSPGEAVTLEVSLGSSTQPVTIPDVTGQSIAVAQASLQSANLSVRMVFTTSAPPGGATPDTVLSQLPIGGTAGHTGDIVTLTVLSPSAQYPVPSVAGMTTLAAATTLGQAGLSVSATTTSTCSNTVAPGNVVDTSPTQGTLVKSGDSVTLVVASAVCNVVVPKVTGLTLTAATTSLTGQGLVGVSSKLPANQCSLADAGLVMSQDQSPGESIPYNSIVNLTYCG
jgi:serine/threonine-protein kinase